ncbi:hypothetical protein D9M71_398060 [compost metagenome]
MQDRQALGHDGAQVFQFFRAELVLPGFQQQGDGHVEALQRLGDGAGQQRKLHEFPRAGRRADVGVVLLAQQTLFHQRFQPFVHFGGQLLHIPADEQLCLQIRIECVDEAQQLLAADSRVALEEAGDQRRQGEHVQDVVAVVGHQYRVLLVEVEDAAERVLLFGEQVQAAGVFDQVAAAAFRQGCAGRVGHLAQEVQIEVENAGQGDFIQRLAACG